MPGAQLQQVKLTQEHTARTPTLEGGIAAKGIAGAGRKEALSNYILRVI